MEGVAGHTIVPVRTLAPMTRERAILLLQQAGVAGLVALKLVDTFIPQFARSVAEELRREALIKQACPVLGRDRSES